jgi:hypothetical protein
VALAGRHQSVVRALSRRHHVLVRARSRRHHVLVRARSPRRSSRCGPGLPGVRGATFGLVTDRDQYATPRQRNHAEILVSQRARAALTRYASPAALTEHGQPHPLREPGGSHRARAASPATRARRLSPSTGRLTGTSDGRAAVGQAVPPGVDVDGRPGPAALTGSTALSTQHGHLELGSMIHHRTYVW